MTADDLAFHAAADDNRAARRRRPVSTTTSSSPRLGGRLLIAVRDQTLVAQLVSLLMEGGRYELVGAVATLDAVIEHAQDGVVDVLLLHEDLGPLGVFDNLRTLVARVPTVATVLLVREDSPQAYRSALHGGARGLLQLPPSVVDLHGALDGAMEWSRAISSPGAETGGGDAHGRVVVLAGAKGGVGTSTVAVHLGRALLEDRRRRVCLVDFDLQSGDIGNLLGVTPRHSVIDLLSVSDETDRRPLEESLAAHGSGLQVLLAPLEGEQSDRVDTSAARRVLSALRTIFDVVIVDIGSVVTEAGAAAAEAADLVLVVATPDALAMRGTVRLLGLWERLHVRVAQVRVVINRASRRSEVQGDLIGKVTRLPVLRTQLPAGFWELEPTLTGDAPRGSKPGPVMTSMGRLRDELGLAKSARRRGRAAGARSETGSLAVELVLVLLPMLLTGLVMLQLLLGGLTAVLGTHAALEGAREYSRGGDWEEAAVEDLPGAWDDVELDHDDDELRVTLAVPTLPGLGGTWSMTVRAGAREDGAGGFLGIQLL